MFGGLILVEIVNVAFYDPYGDDTFLWRLAGSLRGVPIDWLSILMFGSLLVLLAAGMPLVFVTGSLGVLFIYLVGDQMMLNIIPTRIFPLMTNYQLSAIPLFIFMASMLERAGLIDEMFDVIYKWLGGLRGGLAAATVIASTVLAAMVGVIGAAVVTMGIIALPAMLKRKYDPQIALGSIMAGGTLGILIPAVDPGDHLCGRGAGVGGRALYRLADPRSDALRSLHRLRLAARADQPGSRPVAAAGGAGGLGARSCGCCARCWRRSS